MKSKADCILEVEVVGDGKNPAITPSVFTYFAYKEGDVFECLSYDEAYELSHLVDKKIKNQKEVDQSIHEVAKFEEEVYNYWKLSLFDYLKSFSEFKDITNEQLQLVLDTMVPDHSYSDMTSKHMKAVLPAFINFSKHMNVVDTSPGWMKYSTAFNRI